MSNTVFCKLSVVGDPTDLDRFKLSCQSKTSHFTFTGLVPPPVERPGAEWKHCNWSTSSDAREYSEFNVEEENVIHILFETAWFAPQKWLSAAAKAFPQMSFLLSWVDNCDGGHFWAEKGELHTDTMLSSQNKASSFHASRIGRLCYSMHDDLLEGFKHGS